MPRQSDSIPAVTGNRYDKLVLVAILVYVNILGVRYHEEEEWKTTYFGLKSQQFSVTQFRG